MWGVTSVIADITHSNRQPLAMKQVELDLLSVECKLYLLKS